VLQVGTYKEPILVVKHQNQLRPASPRGRVLPVQATGEETVAKEQRSPGDWVQLKINVRERLRAKLEQAAADNGRPMNAEIVDRLDRSFEKENQEKLIKAAAKAAATASTAELRAEIFTVLGSKKTGT
jgi:Arc-like DNA binding domain